MIRSPSMRGRATLAVVLLLLATVVLEGHVTISPGEVRANASQRFTVRVPSERPEPTVRLRLELPAGLGTPRFQPKAGWKYEVEKDPSGKVTAVTWSGGAIGPEEFDEFVFSARAPKDVGPLTFKAIQTYQSGTIASWTGPMGSESPAPVVEVRDSTSGPSAAGAASDERHAENSPGGSASAPPTDGGSDRGGPDRTGRLALVLSIAALGVALLGLRRRA